MTSPDQSRHPDDPAALLEPLAEAAERADGAAPLDEATWLAVRHRPETLHLLGDERGVALALDDDLTLVVHPDHRGTGLGARLLHELRDRVSPGPTHAWSHADHPAARALAAREGWTPVRELWVMRRPDAALAPLTVPDGVRVRGYEPRDEQALLAVNAAAFAHHPEQGSMDSASLAERMAEPWFDPAGLLVAEDATDGTLLGFHWTKRHSPTLGEVYVVGIAPAAQGRGLGGVLTNAGLHHLRDGGAREVLLYVEADNAPAVAVYRRLGFEHHARDTHVHYRRG